MPFIRYSPEYFKESFTLIDNLFVSEYLPYAPEDAVKAYIYGLYLSSRPGQAVSEKEFSDFLGMTAEQTLNAFQYFNERGVVEIISKSPLEIKYLPLKESMRPPKKFDKDKYSDFNRQLQELFQERMLTPNEYNEYYYLMDTVKLAPEATLMIAKYCADYKGQNVRYPYILAVARSWAAEGILTVEAVEAKLKELEAGSEEMRELFGALGRKGAPAIADMQEYMKWTRSWGFTREAVLYAAKSLKGRGSIQKLDRLLDEFFRREIFDIKDMEEYGKKRESLYDTAAKLTAKLGLRYESLDNVIETYIAPWINKGYSPETLEIIAQYCFTGGHKYLEYMNGVIIRFYRLGLVSAESINAYIAGLIKNDEAIRALLEKAGVNKNVTAADRAYYKTWSEDWGMASELIDYAAELNSGAPYAMSFINKTLSDWKNSGVTDVSAARNTAPRRPAPHEPAKPAYITREYTKDQLNALFDDIDDSSGKD